VHKHVQHLVEKGYLRKAWNRSRSVEPAEEADRSTVALPLLGTVAAGAPIEAIEVREHLQVPASSCRPARTASPRGAATSMIDEQIRDGDVGGRVAT
jgi:repressor LexA